MRDRSIMKKNTAPSRTNKTTSGVVRLCLKRAFHLVVFEGPTVAEFGWKIWKTDIKKYIPCAVTVGTQAIIAEKPSGIDAGMQPGIGGGRTVPGPLAELMAYAIHT